ncbi:MAG TPA: hypothetical protein H9850_08365 [Candidatus Anaerobiospirillum pullistercoris]|uniref:Uncharacterized protein n=1 Tax=Candidatus Anaerobiospirillum pullistercoris TaxID=2838452 RepID=A0A9D1WFX6_9GAMM|nr:hypothetical protein [Candidatus Anaerobiospirillum pullistercoris]
MFVRLFWIECILGKIKTKKDDLDQIFDDLFLFLLFFVGNRDLNHKKSKATSEKTGHKGTERSHMQWEQRAAKQGAVRASDE